MRALKFNEKIEFAVRAKKMANEFHRVQYLPKEEIKAIQNQRFLKLFRHACTTVPFYQKKYKEAGVLIDKIRSVDDIKELPVVEKAELIAGYPDQVLSQKFQDMEKLFMFVTGGTSGQTIQILHSRESMYASLVSYHRAFANMMGGRYAKGDVTAYVYTSPYPFKSIFGAYPQKFIWTLDPIETIREKLLRASPHLLTAYPSVLEKLTKELSLQDRRLIGRRLKAISLNSEMSSQSQRDDWEDAWEVPVLDEFCSEEISTIMFHQCPSKRYHIHQDLCVIESVDDNGKPVPYGTEGDLIATALWNYAMPFIRYNQQDRVILEDPNVTCGCGLNFPLLRSFQGRTNDAFTLRSGRVLSSGYLLDVGYAALVDYADTIKYWSLIQEKVDHVVLECVLAPNANSDTIKAIERDISGLFFGEATASLRVVDAPPKSAKGKRKQILSRIQATSSSIVQNFS